MLGFIIAFVLICVMLHYEIRAYTNYELDADLEACRPLLTEENLRTYQAAISVAHEMANQERETRRMMRDERRRDDVAAVYRISVQRNNVGADSVSSDSSDSESEDEYDEGAGYVGESDDSSESSESSDSSSGEDSEEEMVLERSETVLERSESSELRMIGLPRRVAVLRRV